MYINSYDDDDKNYKAAEEKSSKNIGNSKLLRSSTLTTNKPKKNKTDISLGGTCVALSRNNNLSRSNTFTLEDEDNLENGTYPRSHKKGKIPNVGRYREAHATDGFDEPNGR